MKRKIESVEDILDDFCRRNLDFDTTVGLMKFRMWFCGAIGVVVGAIFGSLFL